MYMYTAIAATATSVRSGVSDFPGPRIVDSISHRVSYVSINHSADKTLRIELTEELDSNKSIPWRLYAGVYTNA